MRSKKSLLLFNEMGKNTYNLNFQFLHPLYYKGMNILIRILRILHIASYTVSNNQFILIHIKQQTNLTSKCLKLISRLEKALMFETYFKNLNKDLWTLGLISC